MRICVRMRGADAAACVRGVPDQALSRKPAAQLRLIRMCATADCYEWLGRTLAVVTNGGFVRTGCTQLGPAARRSCTAGAGRMDDALVTFS
jgi:hypothetical protein